MTCYAGESLPGYDAWRTAEPDWPPEDEPLEYCLTVEITVAVSLDPSTARETADCLAEDILKVLRAHGRALVEIDRFDDSVVAALEMA